jgi:hypothetical protein
MRTSCPSTRKTAKTTRRTLVGRGSRVHENFHLTKAAYQQILAKAHCRVLEARVRCAELEQTFALSQTTPPSALRFWVDNFVYQHNGRPFLSLLEVQLSDRKLGW